MTTDTTDTTATAVVEAALGELTLEEKVRLLTGRDFWATVAIDRVGLRSMTLSDGPSGVRGPAWDERDPSLNLPSASALSASWDPSIAYRYGAVAAAEARRKGVDVVLGPTINIHRSALGGRHFEAFSEDPHLTAKLAAAYVAGLQDNGVAATPKHYVANDSETDRFTVNVNVSERALREVYLAAFETAITEAHAWLVMSAYNSINGVTATENELLTSPLVTEWAFDGVVVSDWTAVRSLDSARAGQHLVMPGPQGPWGDALVAAVRAGSIAETVVDEKVRRVLLLAHRVGALAPAVPRAVDTADAGPAFARFAAAEGIVLLENRGELPWAPGALGSVAVLGSNARVSRTQGGGSATVVPEHTVSPLDGLRAALPGARVEYSLGATNQVGLAPLEPSGMTNPVTGEPGARVAFLDHDGNELFVEDRRAAEIVYFGGDAPVAEAASIEFSTAYEVEDASDLEIGCAVTGRARFWIDGELVFDEVIVPDGEDLGAALLSPRDRTVPVSARPGVPVNLRFAVDLDAQGGALSGVMAFTVGTRPAAADPADLIADAVALARTSDVAVVVVGTNAKVESEGFDRTTLALPGHQDALVTAVAAANPRTVVLVNAGSPVLMPWRSDVAAVLVGWFGGQEFGHAVADVLLGACEPGGRLPTTWAAADAGPSVLSVTPVDGALHYDEGIHVGYRGWLRTGEAPAYWLGHGSGYTTFALSDLTASDVSVGGRDAIVELTVENTGEREGKAVVLVFAERPHTAIERPVRWLVGSAVARVAPGERRAVQITVPARAFAHWEGSWQHEPGEFVLRAGTAVDSLPLTATTHLEA